MNDILKAILLGIVEGLTEFLPVSSTGHMRLVEAWIGPILSEHFSATFDVFIQLGAILAVVVYFREKIADLLKLSRPKQGFEVILPPSNTTGAPPESEGVPTAPSEPPDTIAQKKHVLMMIALATAPLAIGFFPAKMSDAYFTENPRTETLVIAIALGLGGVLMILIEQIRRKPRTTSLEGITPKQAIIVGFAQILAAVFPGTSRSAATIMASLMLGMNRSTAAEFSFFLAIPAMFAAAGYKLLKFIKAGGATTYEFLLLSIGFLVSFIVAYFVIAAFMSLIRKYTFVPYGLYRIVLAIVVLLLLWW